MRALQEAVGPTPTLRVPADSSYDTPTPHSGQGQTLRGLTEETSC